MAHIFVIWDSRLHAVGATAGGLRDRPSLAKGHRFSILGVHGDRAIGELEARIREEIHACDGLLAYIDQANANMAWEIGLGLGVGKPVALATEAATAPAWIQGTPFEAMLRQHRAASATAMRALADQHPQWLTLDRHPRRGETTLVLCPRDDAGEICCELILDEWPDLRELDVAGWRFSELPDRLDDVGRVIWVLPPRTIDQTDHGPLAAVHALVAGYAATRGIPLKVLYHAQSVVPADQAGRALAWTGHDQLLARIRTFLAEQPPATGRWTDPAEVVGQWRAVMSEAHARAIPLLYGVQEAALQAVYVQLAVRGRDTAGGSTEAPVDTRHVGRLEAFIEDDLTHRQHAGRWLVTAPPGAGKTTLARHLVHALARAGDRVPVFLRLADLDDAHPWDVADRLFRDARPDAPLGSLRSALEVAAKVRGRVWLFLDGLDEVRDLQAAALRVHGYACDPAWREVVFVVLTREVGDEALRAVDRDRFTRLEVLPLDPGQQAALVDNLAAAELVARGVAADLHRALAAGAVPAGLATNPLLLSLVALTTGARAQGGHTPRLERVGVLWAAVELLLDGRHRSGPPDPARTARMLRVLVPLALAWQRHGGERWTGEELEAALRPIHADLTADPDLARVWPTVDAVRDDLDRHAGVVGRFDGPRSGWGWLHRSLRERLAAEALAGMGAAARAALLAAVTAPEAAWSHQPAWYIERRDAEQAEFGPWAETLGMVVGRLPAPERAAAVDRLVTTSPAAAARALSALEGLPPWDHLAALLRCVDGSTPPYPHWHNDDLDGAIAMLQARGDAVDRLWAEVRPRPTPELGVLWYALERLHPNGPDGHRADAARFFAQCGRPQSAAPTLATVRVDGERLTFRMGSPDGVGDDNERPAHRVTLTRPFALGVTPVTVGEYRRFDPDHRCPGGDRHPVAEVDWFTARLFAAWVGGRLPTEAEWECACRAGTSTAWSFGDDAAELADHGWFDGNSREEAHPVGEKRPNPWGLRDVHGNVWEWCECRWQRRFDGDVADPVGPDRGGGRVVRSGSAWLGADECRSACRGGNLPAGRDVSLGFRVALP